MERKKLVHTERIALRWGDMDAMGHVNNTVYFRCMEQARIGWFHGLFQALLPPEEAWESTGIVIVNASCNFRKPVKYPGTLEVKLYLGAAGRSSVPTFYDLTLAGELCADGAAVVVFIDMHAHRAVRIPERIRPLLQ
jgi:acyl-CoA thioester hydrolase